MNRHEEAVDWVALARRFEQIQHAMIREGIDRHTLAFTAEALRRLVSAAPELGLASEFAYTLDSHTVVDRMNREHAEARTKEVIAEYRTERAALARDLAEQLRNRCNDRIVPARLRREGVELAAAWLERQGGHQ